jgi:ABC-type branched-subunit amino acid transport system ATPase component
VIVAIPFRVSSLSFNGGDVVDTSAASVVVFVGPNNVGKTRTLQELPGFLERPLTPEDVARSGHVALSGVAIEKQLFDSELTDWITSSRYT